MKERKKTNRSFVVDIGRTMFESNQSVSVENLDKQTFFCKCGASHNFAFKLKRNMVKNYDSIIEDKESIEKLKCNKCPTEYNSYNKISVLTPDIECIFNVSFHNKQWINADNQKVSTLYKKKELAMYASKTRKLELINRVDFISFNHSTQLISLFINHPGKDQDSNGNSGSGNSSSTNTPSIKEENLNIDAISETLSLSNLTKLSLFFRFFEFVNYDNLDQAFAFIQSLDNYVVDLPEVKKIFFVNHIYNNADILSEINEKNGEKVYFQMKDNGFGENVLIKKTLSFGNYLKDLEDITRLYFAIISFPHLTTIYLTKGEDFLFELLREQDNKSNVCNPNVYFSHGATFPYKIMEVSTNYNKIGIFKGFIEENKKLFANVAKTKKDIMDMFYLKISPILYKNINKTGYMDLLVNVFYKSFFSKSELEYVFQNFESSKIYNLFAQLDKSTHRDVRLSLKHIVHMLTKNLESHNSDYLTIYIDTLNLINLLDLPQTTIFKVHDSKELKSLHDDLSAKYNSIKDIKKAEFYEKAVKDFKHLNQTIDYVNFSPLPTLESLNKEGSVMHHCIYSYLDRICDKKYLAIDVYHTISRERATMGLIRKGSSLEIEQLKGYCNSRASAWLIETVHRFLSENKISVPSNTPNDLHPAKGSQNSMDNYIPEEEAKKIVKKLEMEKRIKEEKKFKGETDKSVKKGTKFLKKLVSSKILF